MFEGNGPREERSLQDRWIEHVRQARDPSSQSRRTRREIVFGEKERVSLSCVYSKESRGVNYRKQASESVSSERILFDHTLQLSGVHVDTLGVVEDEKDLLKFRCRRLSEILRQSRENRLRSRLLGKPRTRRSVHSDCPLAGWEDHSLSTADTRQGHGRQTFLIGKGENIHRCLVEFADALFLGSSIPRRRIDMNQMRSHQIRGISDGH